MSILSQLRSNPIPTLIMLLYRIPAVLIALTLHELAHGYVARRCGDPTAEMMGRLSFNPLRHLDPIGTVFMLLFGFGWARPVPVNPRNFKNYRRDDLLVSLAGITANLLLFVGSSLVMVGLNQLIFTKDFWQLGKYYPLLSQADFLKIDGYNFSAVLSGENYFFVQAAGENSAYYAPISELQEFIRYPWLLYVQRFFMIFSLINLGLALFNLLPIPPLDGYHVCNDILARGRLNIPQGVMNGIMIVLLIVCFTTNFLSDMLYAVEKWVQGGLIQGVLMLFGLRT